MARVLDSEALNSPYVNLPINVERSHITSALIDLEIWAEFWEKPTTESITMPAVSDCRETTAPPGVWEDYTPTRCWKAERESPFQVFLQGHRQILTSDAHSKTLIKIYITPEC